MPTIKFSSINLYHFINYELKSVIPFYINNIYLSNHNRFNIIGEKGINLIIDGHRASSYIYLSETTYAKSKHGFNSVLTSLLKGKKIISAEQHAMDRILILNTNGDIRIIIQFIPGRFNFMIADKENIIMNQYSYIKDKSGNILYNIGDKFIFPEKKELKKYLSSEEKVFVEKNNIQAKELLEEKVKYIYSKANSYRILSFNEDDDYLYTKGSISECIKYIVIKDSENILEKDTESELNKLDKEIKGLEQKIHQMRNNEKLLKQIDDFSEMGETLKMHINELKGKENILLESVFDKEKMLNIPLNPALSPSENMKHYFNEANRKKGQMNANGIRLRAFLERIEFLKIQYNKIRNGEILIEPEGKRKKKKQEKRIGREFISPSGFKIIAGRNAKENDFITTKIASKNDLFFHAREKHGSHVILITEGKNIDKNDIIYAGSIAACYSDGKHSNLVAVQYTEARYVVKRKKSPPGTVYMMREKVIMVKPAKP